MGLLIISDSAPESIEKSISRSGDSKSLFFGLSKRSGIVQIFSLGSWILFEAFDICCLCLDFL